MDILQNNYIRIILSSMTVYLFVIIAIRLFGKKELSQLSVIDLVFVLLISNSVQNAMVGSDSTLLGGLIAASSLFIVNYIFKQFIYHSPKFSKLIQGESILLIYDGVPNQKNIAASMLTMDELMEAIREHGVSRIEDVDLAILEVDGNISVLTNNFQTKSKRKRKTKPPVQIN
jgi:Predicted membrane protein